MYVPWMRFTISVAANQTMHFYIEYPENDRSRTELWTYSKNYSGVYKPVLGQSAGNHCTDLCRQLWSKSENRVNWRLSAVCHCCMEASNVLQEADSQCQQWKQSLRWFIHHWNVHMWRVWVSLDWIKSGNFFILPIINLGGLHYAHGEGIHKHHIMDSYRPRMCHDHCLNA